MADKRKSSYSWKSPWAFRSFHRMRRTLTERFVYKKLGFLERHSSFKKPYRQRQHKLGELDFSYRDWPILPPGGSGPIPPPGGCADAKMACLGGMLDCKGGGCDIITCICGIPPYSVELIDDPTGRAEVEHGFFPKVCLPDNVHIECKYCEIIARVTDSVGQSFIVRHPLVDCEPCCDPFTFTGAATQNPDSTWSGTVDPPCGEATVSVSSNSGCSLSASIDAAGETVTVDLGAADCGTFTVTVQLSIAGCTAITASLAVRINDVGGNGGAWGPATVSMYCDVGDATCGNAADTEEGSCTDDGGEGAHKFGRNFFDPFPDINYCGTTYWIGCYDIVNDDPGAPPYRCPVDPEYTGSNCYRDPCTGRTCGAPPRDMEGAWQNAGICKWGCSC